MERRFDVLVIGGGPAGLAAAVAAARLGQHAALVERHDILGGMGTAALVSNFCNAHWDGRRLIIGGLFAELRQRLIDRGALYVTGGMEPYDPAAFHEESLHLCREAGVELLTSRRVIEARFTSQRADVRLDDGTTLIGRTVVDASGDAVVAAMAGVPSQMGRPGDGAVMPLTYCYIAGPVDIDALEAQMPDAIHREKTGGQRYVYLGGHARLREAVKEARQAGWLTIPRDRIAVAISIPGRPEYLAVNYGRVFIQDPTDPAQLAQAEKEGREQIEQGIRFFRQYVPGMQDANVVEIARQIGVRESRQIRGRYTLDRDDVLGCRQFEDVIAQCCYSIDIHNPGDDGTTMCSIPRGSHYDIPWRCLVPQEGPANLIVAGRSISATQEAMSSFRVSPSVMAIGEAAGVTAALAAVDSAAIGAVDVTLVQERLRQTGGVLN